MYFYLWMANHAVDLVKLPVGQTHIHMSSLKHLNYVMPPCHASHWAFNKFKSILIMMKTDVHRQHSKLLYNDGRWPLKIMCSNFFVKPGPTLKLSYIVQNLVQLSFMYFQGWRYHSLSGHQFQSSVTHLWIFFSWYLFGISVVAVCLLPLITIHLREEYDSFFSVPSY